MKYDVSLTDRSNADIHFISSFHRDLSWGTHIHRRIELILVTDGEFRVQSGDSIYSVRSGEMMFVPPFTPHGFESVKRNACYIIEFSSEVYAPFYAWLSSHRTDTPVASIPDFPGAFLSLLPQEKLMGLADEPLPVMLTDAILAPICHAFYSRCRWTEAERKYDDIYLQALDFITENYSKPLSRETVAKHIGIRPETLSRKFSEKSIMSFSDSVHQIRIYKAKYFLDCGMSVSEAAYHVGFENIRTFNRAFRKIIGCTPTEYCRHSGISRKTDIS